MITHHHKTAGNYYRVCILELSRKYAGNTVVIKCEYHPDFETAGKVAGQWASDLPKPIACHHVTIQHIEAK